MSDKDLKNFKKSADDPQFSALYQYVDADQVRLNSGLNVQQSTDNINAVRPWLSLA